MLELKLDSIKPWTAHPKAAPVTERIGDFLIISANGTRTCVGGWELSFSGVKPGESYLIQFDVEHEDLDSARDTLRCKAYWDKISATDPQQRDNLRWDYLLPEKTEGNTLRFSRCLTAPEGSDCLTLCCTFRWTTKGKSRWHLPRIESAPPPTPSRPVKIAVVTGRSGSRRGPFKTIQDNLDFYVPLCKAACQSKPDLIVLPEIALQWGIAGSPIDLAVPVPGSETDVFAELARYHTTLLLLGMIERDEDAVHNSAVLIGPEGEIEGKYRKVHLAVGGEVDSGILPGDDFPVFDTEIGRIGCNICMDSSAAESARMVGLNGADFLLLPIMGDHRADRWSQGPPIYNESRWKAIMRTRAMDNQFCMVVARNNAQGSCIIDRKGDFLAWNEGDHDFVEATVTLEDNYRMWNKGCFREVNWMQRRPHIYQEFVNQDNKGSL